MHDHFRILADRVSQAVGSIWAVAAVAGAILITGYIFDFSNDWERRTALAATVIALLLLIFLQQSQIHSDRATHLKLDELVKAVKGARSELASIENESVDVLENLKN